MTYVSPRHTRSTPSATLMAAFLKPNSSYKQPKNAEIALGPVHFSTKTALS